MQSDGIEPEFGYFTVTLDVNMDWFISIPSIEEKTVRASRQDCRHLNLHGYLILYRNFLISNNEFPVLSSFNYSFSNYW